MPAGRDDIRNLDLEAHVLGHRVTFDEKWPAYSEAGYIAMVESPAGEWALICAMPRYFVVEYRGRIGIISKTGQ